MKKTLISFLLILAMAASLVFAGCGGGTADNTPGGKNDKSVTIIKIYNFDGGVGQAWLDDAGARFSALKADEEYEEGKKGVKITITVDTTSDASTRGEHIIFTENSLTPKDLANKGVALDITDIVKGKYGTESKTIEDKLDPTYRNMLKVGETYYALPHYELYPGLSYDKDNFDKYGLYFVDSGNPYTASEFGAAYFLGDNPGATKLGDGMPKTIQQLLILCDYMKQKGVTPFIVPSNHMDYSGYLEAGLLAALLGDDIDIMYTFDSKGKEMEVVTGVGTEDLFYNGSGIKAPVTEKMLITEANGYQVRNLVERYYVLALIKMLSLKRWVVTSDNNIQTQTDFVNGYGTDQYAYGFIMEGSYWYNEAKENEIFSEYEENYGGNVRQFGWMNLPTALNEEDYVASKNGALIDFAGSFCFINKKVSSNAGLMRACKEFVQFLYSDDELVKFSENTGVAKAAVEYNVNATSSKLSDYQKSVMELKKNSKVVYPYATNKTYQSLYKSFTLSNEGEIWRYNSLCVLEMAEGGKSAYDIFQNTSITEENWNKNYYKGDK